MTRERKDIVVIGAGPAALSFARAMKNSGLQLTLLEQVSRESVVAPEYDGREIVWNRIRGSLKSQERF